MWIALAAWALVAAGCAVRTATIAEDSTLHGRRKQPHTQPRKP
jgi:hypothetical protein